MTNGRTSNRGGRHERRPETAAGASRRGLLIGGAVAGAAAIGGGAWALTSLGGDDDSGAKSSGGGLFGGGEETQKRALDSLADLSQNVPKTSTVDLSKLEKNGVPVSFPRIGSARGISEALDMAANKILREHAFAGDDAGDLSVTGRIFLTGASVIGAALLVTEGSGDTAESSASVVYYRAKGDRPYTSCGLIAAKQWATFTQAVATAAQKVEDVDASSLATALQEQPRPWGNGPAILPDADGSLHVVFPAALVAGKRAEAQVDLDAATAAPLLSDEGNAVLAAAKSPGAFDPKTVTVPGKDRTYGDEIYREPSSVPEGRAARTREDGVPGPVSQLSGAGTRPAVVAAPDASRLKAMSLTFDDGPSPELNKTLRQSLNKARAAATFYMIGQSVQAYPMHCAATAANGFEIGSHSWSHAQLSAISADRLTAQVTKPAEAIEKAAGRAPFVMRPPYGARNRRVDQSLRSLGESAQIWDVDTLDWQTLSVSKNIQHVQNETRRGSIVLMHEIHPTSVKAVPDILEWLAEDGFTLLTASEIGQNQMYAGKYYMKGLITHEIEPKGQDGSSASDAGGASDGGSGQG